MRKTTILALLALSACAAPPSEEASPPRETAASAPVLPFIADDYPAARAEALERDLPVFVESWAPW